MNKCVDFGVLKGKTITKIDGLKKGSYKVTFYCSDGSEYEMKGEWIYADITIEDVCGDVDQLIGTPILLAYEETNADEEPLNDADDSYTWCFYHLGTIKGYVDIRWYGTSSGYYSEEVKLHKTKQECTYTISHEDLNKNIEPRQALYFVEKRNYKIRCATCDGTGIKTIIDGVTGCKEHYICDKCNTTGQTDILKCYARRINAHTVFREISVDVYGNMVLGEVTKIKSFDGEIFTPNEIYKTKKEALQVIKELENSQGENGD